MNANLKALKAMLSGATIIALVLMAGQALGQTCQMDGDQCTVTVATGEGDGTLKSCINTGSCSTILFDTAVMGTNEVQLPSLITVDDSVTIDGQDNISITGDFNPSYPMFNVKSTGIIFQNLTMSHTNGLLLYFTGSGNTVKSCTLTGNSTAIKVKSGQNNYFTQNSFSGNSTAAISLTNYGNMELAEPALTDAQLISETQWQMSGTIVKPDVTKVEIYEADPSQPGVSQGKTYITTLSGADVAGETFTVTFDLAENHPAKSYTALAFDDSNNTSAFAVNFTPTNAADFFGADYAACADAVWWMSTEEGKGGWAGDYDHGGKTNGEEDANKNCVYEEELGETNPEDDADDALSDSDGDDTGGDDTGGDDIGGDDTGGDDIGGDDTGGDDTGDGQEGADSDDDGILDALDNCPLVYNPFQEDEDEDGVGDACEEALGESPPVGGSGGGCSISTSSGNFMGAVILLLSLIAFPFSTRKLWRQKGRVER